jgi:predicted dehydrogenase
VLAESFSLRTPQPGVHVTAHGSRGSLWLHGDRVRLYAASQDGLPDEVQRWAVDPGDTFCREIAHWLDCLDESPTTGQGSPISAREQRKPLLAVLAAYASMQRGERIALAAFERTHSKTPPGGRDDGTER